MTALICTIVFGVLLLVAGLIAAIYLYNRSKEDAEDSSGNTLVSMAEEEYAKVYPGNPIKTYGNKYTADFVKFYKGYKNSAAAKKNAPKGNKKYFGLAFVWLLIGIIPLCNSFTKVGPNEVGVVYDELNGGIQDWTYGEGFHSKSIFQHVTTIPTTNVVVHLESNETKNDSLTCQTMDGQYASLEISLIYHITKDNAQSFYRITQASKMPEDAIKSIIKNVMKEVTPQYTIFELLSTKFNDANSQFQTKFIVAMKEQYYVTVTNASLDDIDAGSEIEAILKKEAEAKKQIEIAQEEAQAAGIKAASDAAVQRTLADADAYATTVKGKAAGDASAAYIKSAESMINRLYCSVNGVADADIVVDKDGYVTSFKPVESSKETLTYSKCANLILGIIFYDTWDGKLPEVLTSDQLSALIGSLLANGASSSSSTSSSSAGA
jgi:regulator of protease activity HflC (stomatin/prohibitin superfamily)